jgi:hypothetical protein
LPSPCQLPRRRAGLMRDRDGRGGSLLEQMNENENRRNRRRKGHREADECSTALDPCHVNRHAAAQLEGPDSPLRVCLFKVVEDLLPKAEVSDIRRMQPRRRNNGGVQHVIDIDILAPSCKHQRPFLMDDAMHIGLFRPQHRIGLSWWKRRCQFRCALKGTAFQLDRASGGVVVAPDLAEHESKQNCKDHPKLKEYGRSYLLMSPSDIHTDAPVDKRADHSRKKRADQDDGEGDRKRHVSPLTETSSEITARRLEFSVTILPTARSAHTSNTASGTLTAAREPEPLHHHEGQAKIRPWTTAEIAARAIQSVIPPP